CYCHDALAVGVFFRGNRGGSRERQRSWRFEAAQLFAPERLRFHKVFFVQPFDELEIRTRLIPFRAAPTLETFVSLKNLAQNQRERSRVQQQVMKCPNQPKILVRKSEQGDSHQRSAIDNNSLPAIILKPRLEFRNLFLIRKCSPIV